jgi:hypothetical protein
LLNAAAARPSSCPTVPHPRTTLNSGGRSGNGGNNSGDKDDGFESLSEEEEEEEGCPSKEVVANDGKGNNKNGEKVLFVFLPMLIVSSRLRGPFR